MFTFLENIRSGHTKLNWGNLAEKMGNFLCQVIVVLHNNPDQVLHTPHRLGQPGELGPLGGSGVGGSYHVDWV